MAETENHPGESPDYGLGNAIRDNTKTEVSMGTITKKAGDLLKIIDLQKQLATDSEAEEKFWEAIEKIRQEELKDV